MCKECEPIRWIKMPGPGQFRGEGTWMLLSEVDPDADWDQLKDGRWLPVHEGDEPPTS